MKRKICVSIMALFMTVSLFGCGKGEVSVDNSTESTVAVSSETDTDDKTDDSKNENIETEKEETTEAVVPLDLTGLWIQDKKSESESRMVATIRDDGKIAVFFILEDDPEPWTYWVGTYDAPTEDTDKYSWTSQNTYGGNGLLASTAETKDFTYKSDSLSFEVTIDGETNTMKLVRGEWDVSSIPDSVFESVNASSTDVKDLEIKDSGWYVDGDYLKYYIVIHNPNEEIAVEFPSFRITARDSDNVVMGTEDQTLSIIYPGQDFYYGSQAFSVDGAPDTVDFEMLSPEEYNLKNASVMDEFKQLEVVNTAVREEKFVGEISNPNSYDIDSAIVVVVCKDNSGNVVYVDSTFVDSVTSGKTVPFSISFYKDIDTTNVEYYANKW